MKFKIEIRNFGKIEQATIQINNLTVLAGKNNTGKSFISKALYAFFHAMNTKDHLYETLAKELESLLEMVDMLKIPYYSRKDIEFINEIRSILSTLRVASSDASISKMQFNGMVLGYIKSLRQNFMRYKEQINDKKKKLSVMSGFLEKMEDTLEKLQQYTKAEILQRNLQRNLGETFKNELKQNFQVRRLQQLIRTQSTKGSSFDIDTVGKILIREDDTVSFHMTPDSFNPSQIIYIESPIYWKLKFALEFNRSSLATSGFLTNDKFSRYLTSVPNYFYDLANLLRLQSIDEPQFKEILENIEQEIGGRLHLSDTGDLVFQTKKEGTHPISITALGVANLGMVAMLLEKNLIDAGSFLFIDEPEAHLHPAWQVTLMKTLYQLASQDVNIVITTHSVDMLKCLEILVKEDPNAKESIALNHLGVEGRSLNENVEFEEKIGLMKQDLLEPFYNLYLEGL